jgi:hypothetical protein
MNTRNTTIRRRSTAIPFPAPQPQAAPSARHEPRPDPVTAAELSAWVQAARDLPDIRWDKVAEMREAIRNQTLDTDDRLARLADMLPTELITWFAVKE